MTFRIQNNIIHIFLIFQIKYNDVKSTYKKYYTLYFYKIVLIVLGISLVFPFVMLYNINY